MKTNSFGKAGTGLVCLALALSMLGLARQTEAQSTAPTILSIQPERNNLVLAVSVPAGLRQLTLESRERFGVGAWTPRLVQSLDGTGGRVVLRLPRSRNLELLRLRADERAPLPAAFYTGATNFAAQPASADAADPTKNAGPGVVNYDGTAEGGGGAPTRTVTESDIWKTRGQTLYFFNQYRGLQIIDLANPEAPAVQGTLDLPASGEQMYLLGGQHVVLLARSGCYYNQGDESRVVVVADQAGTPVITAQLSVSGYISESRMVGSALYVSSQVYRTITNKPAGDTWEWGTMVTSFDLADPAAPVKRDTLWFSGYGSDVAAASDRFFFVITQDPAQWSQSIVSVVDISAPDGSMRALGSVRPDGYVQDKFKLNVSGDVLTIISQARATTNLLTKLQTYSLADPAHPVALGHLYLGSSEQLYATRFDGNRVYVVTFHVQWRIDPLWVVDLSDPAHPHITGQLEIPGWSTYLEPLGDRLVALGIETNRTTVSLFDVADPAKPALLSRVALGEGWSWSEANNDEKAFNVLPADNLILVPFYSWSTNGQLLQVQLIDLLPKSVVARGAIDHQFQPRRATLYENHVLSVSGRELLTVNVSDRDHPVVSATTELSWPVDRIVAHGDYLVELSATSRYWRYWWWGGYGQQDPAVIRVAAAADPDRLLTRLDLGTLPVVGATAHDDRLYVLQTAGGSYYYPLVTLDPSTTNPTPTLLRLTVFDLKALPQLTPLSQIEAEAAGPVWGGDMQAFWPRPGVLVWAANGGGYGCWMCPMYMDAMGGAVRLAGAPAPGLPAPPVALPAPVAPTRAIPAATPGTGAAVMPASVSGAVSRFMPYYWPWWNVQNRLLAFDVTDPAAPALASDISIDITNSYSFSQPFAAEGLIYLSHATSEFVPGLDSPWKTPAYTNTYQDSATGQWITNTTVAGSWVQRFFLDVIDYADATTPTLRQPVGISGLLQGVSHQGAMVYADRSQYTPGTNGYTWSEQLDALAYDGVTAHLVDSLPLPNFWPRPLLILSTNLYLGRSGYNYTAAPDPNYLEIWTIPDSAKFTPINKIALTSAASTLQVLADMLVAQENDSTLAFFDLTDPAKPRLLSETKPITCNWFDLSRADGDQAGGLWAPMSDFGVIHIPVGPK